MDFSVLVFVLALSDLVLSLDGLSPTPTISKSTFEQSPDPTSLPTRARELLRRGDVSPYVCGYYNSTSSYTCSSSLTCKFNTDYNVVGCCSGDKCDFKTTCYDLSEYSKSCTNTCKFNTLVAFWNEHFESGFTRIFCDRVATVPDRASIFFTSAGQITAAEGLPRLTGRGGTGEITSLSITTSPTITTVFSTITNSSGKTNVGAIAGGVVGGLAVLSITALLLVLLLRKPYRRSRSGTRVASAAAERNRTPILELDTRKQMPELDAGTSLTALKPGDKRVSDREIVG